jgi:hypothetical protein
MKNEFLKASLPAVILFCLTGSAIQVGLGNWIFAIVCLFLAVINAINWYAIVYKSIISK